MVALQILVLSVEVRIPLSQQKEERSCHTSLLDVTASFFLLQACRRQAWGCARACGPSKSLEIGLCRAPAAAGRGCIKRHAAQTNPVEGLPPAVCILLGLCPKPRLFQALPGYTKLAAFRSFKNSSKFAPSARRLMPPMARANPVEKVPYGDPVIRLVAAVTSSEKLCLSVAKLFHIPVTCCFIRSRFCRKCVRSRLPAPVWSHFFKIVTG